ncbi:hypothetical protein E1176_16720 [Fulvivirga sp. RKSG066]|uniref:hypothetical protein n=1 Tax=Fulvivirga aurantia TaxID=2529383 RepID=UPI0012BCD1AE|nr:hypothetical protein [Fulvivirga aurantia]MTI22678.1 hypothetical protein [Fulvivirga aurantia]
MNNNINYLRVYDEKLDLLLDTAVSSLPMKSSRLDALLKKSKLFLNVDNIACYRIVPELR